MERCSYPGLDFGKDLGPVSIAGLNARHHSEVTLSGELIGRIYKGRINGVDSYEFRSEKGIGVRQLTWFSAADRVSTMARVVQILRETSDESS